MVDLSSSGRKRPLKPGVVVPTVVFFDPESEDIDLETVASHAVRLAKAGVVGITTQGSNGEAVHLTHGERHLITRTTREALGAAGFTNLPIIVGCGAQSTRETIELCVEAQDAGGDYALVLSPSYYKPSYIQSSLLEYLRDVASASPIPILIYNYPGAVAGIDLDSDAIIQLAKHPNIVGCKLTCGNTGKLNRVASATRSATPWQPSGFMCMGGSADFTLQTLIGGGSGVITGLGNVTPKACVKVFDLYAAGEVAEAQKIQAIVARGDWAAISGGIVGTKSALQSHFGYGGDARRPLPKPSQADVAKFAEQFREVVNLERRL
jgi:4-hydroxy-2-oxoglutarate aldolase